MQVKDVLRILNVDPAQLPPVIGLRARSADAFARAGRNPKPCVACGRPVMATRIADIPSVGPRWIDTCTPHMIATTKTASTGGSEPAALAALRDAVRQSGVEAALLTTPLTAAECAGG